MGSSPRPFTYEDVFFGYLVHDWKMLIKYQGVRNATEIELFAHQELMTVRVRELKNGPISYILEN